MFTTSDYDRALAEQQRIEALWAAVPVASTVPGVSFKTGAPVSMIEDEASLLWFVVPVIGWRADFEGRPYGASVTLSDDPTPETVKPVITVLDMQARRSLEILAAGFRSVPEWLEHVKAHGWQGA